MSKTSYHKPGSPYVKGWRGQQRVSGELSPGLHLRYGNSDPGDPRRAALKAAQSSSLRVSKRAAPSMPRMPWENE